ncbi:M48 family metallopeptidase [Eionea flava]
MIVGRWYALGSAESTEAILHFPGGSLVELHVSGQVVLSCHINDIAVSDRLGNVERKLTFTNIGIFSTADNNAVDQALGHVQPLNRVIHYLETHMLAVIIAIVFTIALGVGFFKWGVPWASETIAHALPHKTNELIAKQTLTFLDDYWFEESQLSEERKKSIRQHFYDELVPLDERNQSINYQLHFRSWTQGDKEIPNAFALPSGDIILTDQFVTLTDNQTEVDAVLLHEIGHVVERHSLERLVQGTLVTTLVMLVSGDSSGIADLGLGLGAVLVSSHYSREHELEADTYAFEQMLKAQKDPIAFSKIMGRMEEYVAEVFSHSSVEDDSAEGVEQGAHQDTEVVSDELVDYLSTHPPTAERQQNATRYSECFRQGLLQCDVGEAAE